MADGVQSWTVEEFFPVAKVLARARTILELLPLMLPLAVYTTEKVNSMQPDSQGKRTKERQE